jgi:cell division protein FtsW
VKTTTGVIVAIVLVLAIIGLVMVASTSMFKAESLVSCTLLNRQILWVTLAVIVMFVMMHVDYHWLARVSPWILAGAVLLLLAVLVPGIGSRHNGARRWIRFAGFGIQPSEVAKLAVVLFVAAWFTRGPGRVQSFRWGFVPLLAACGIVGTLILVEPDLGTAVLVGIVGVTVAVLAGMRVRYLVPFILPAGPLFHFLVWNVKWRHDRLLAFLNPWEYYDGVGYQLCQALMALGSGGVFGVGPGQGREKLGFLPEAIHDFVFAVLGEELGFLGTMGVVLLFAVFVCFGMRVAGKARDRLGFLLASGVTLTIGLQALINMAVVTGSMPTKGIALPFVSVGGSSLCCLMASVGLLLNVARQAERTDVVPDACPPKAEPKRPRRSRVR